MRDADVCCQAPCLLLAGLFILLYLSVLLLDRGSNIFRKLGDLSHQIAIAVLILQLVRAKNARGISVKTQELRLGMFLTRYLDLFTTYFSLYNSVMKIVYIIATACIILMIKYTEPFATVYNRSQDSFPHWTHAVLPCIILSFCVHMMGSGYDYFSFMEWAWTYSIMLESIAILPQLVVLRKYRLVENLTGQFVFFLGSYRFLYILNWILRANTERYYRHNLLAYICGCIQTLLYFDFFYQYCRISRLSRCCNKDRNDEDDVEGLIFESERELPVRHSATQSLLSKITDDPLLLVEESSCDTNRRQPTKEDL